MYVKSTRTSVKREVQKERSAKRDVQKFRIAQRDDRALRSAKRNDQIAHPRRAQTCRFFLIASYQILKINAILKIYKSLS